MMEETDFIDYYETLEVSPNATPATIERMFRHFAQQFHPDNSETADRDRFDLVVEAHNTLKDPIKRAQYDIQYKQQPGFRTAFEEEPSDSRAIEGDVDIQNKLLSTFYFKRRQTFNDPGVPEFELERTFDRPLEELEFHLWYLKEKGWIKRLDNGMLAITIDGIDHVNAKHERKSPRKLLRDANQPD